jgi:DNA-binding transcriptional MerR regulator
VRIGELARRAGVNVETIRYYERRGLLGEPPRSPRGHRTYGDEDVRFVRAVKAAQGLGFGLGDVEDLLRIARRGEADVPEAVRVRAARKLDEIDEKLASLGRMRGQLAELIGCGCRSLDDCTCGAAVLARRGVEPRHAPDAPFHLTNGDSTARTLRRTRLRGPVLAWRDVLHEGPVPPRDEATVREARARFFVESGWDERAEDVADELERRDRALLEAIADGREVVLWFEHDLYDQLQLVQVLAMVARSRLPAGAVRLICIDRFDGHPGFAGLGELEAEELASLWPLREPLDAATLATAVEAWDAFRGPDPRALEVLAHDGRSELPFLPAAFVRLLEELPATDDGLGRTERQLLAALAQGATTPHDLMCANSAAEEAPFMGDAWVFRRLYELSVGGRPLVAGVAPPPPLGDDATFRAASFGLTDTGRAVLAGREDRVRAVGIDRWLGGVRVRAPEPWRWDRAARRVVAPPG